MASLDSDAVQALNALLEDARASVEILVELASGATEVAERETCTALGQDTVLLSCALHERLTMMGASVTRRINCVVLHILDTERYDDRLRAFARHQAGTRERAQSLAQIAEDRETRTVLSDLYEASERGALWCEQRAVAFANSRFLIFGAQHTSAAPDGPPDSRNAASPAADTDIPDTTAPDTIAYPHDPMQPDVPRGNGLAGHGPEQTMSDENSEPSYGPPGPSRSDGAHGDEQ